MKNADRLFELGRELGLLEAQKKAIEEKIKEIKVARAGLSGGRREAQGPGGGWAGKVIQVLSTEPDRTFSWTDVAGALSTDKASSVRSTLARLSKEGQIEKEGRGAYKFKKPD